MQISALCLGLSLALSTTFTFAAPPTDQSIQQLFKVMDLDKLTKETIAQLKPELDEQANQIIEMTVQKDQLSDKEKSIAKQLSQKMYDKTMQMMAWKDLEPVYSQVYKESFSQEEIQAQIDFYSTAIGQSILKKTPIVAQKTMSLMSDRMREAVLSQTRDLKDIFKQLDELKKDQK